MSADSQVAGAARIPLALLDTSAGETLGRLHYERRFDAAVTDVFAALVRMLALRRWDPGVHTLAELTLPRPGSRYVRQTTTALREGRVIEIIRPVAVSLLETLHDPPCRVTLRQRWRIHVVSGRSLLQLNLQYRLNHAAGLRRLHWRQQLDRHCMRMLGHVAEQVRRLQDEAAAAHRH